MIPKLLPMVLPTARKQIAVVNPEMQEESFLKSKEITKNTE